MNIHHPQNLTQRLFSSDIYTFLFFSLIAVISLLIRLEDINYLTESLWCEDSELLINQAYLFGLSSLWEPAAGYLHLYHRIIALISRLFPLQITPYIFVFGWILAFLLIVWVLVTRGKLAGIDRATSLLLILAISLQPNDGEVFLNLGQSFYILNIAFAMYLCLPSPNPPKINYLLLLALLSLSGPASEILALALLVRLLFLKDFHIRKFEYLTVWSCALIQLYFTLTLYADSEYQAASDFHVSDWIKPFLTFMIFGSSSNLVHIAAIFFWCVTVMFLCISLGNSAAAKNKEVEWFSPLAAIIIAGIMFFAGMMRLGDEMLLMNPVDHESRYFVLPYALSFFASLCIVKRIPGLKSMVLLAIGLISGASFLTLDRPDRMGSTGLYGHENLQWIAFTKFQQVIPNLMIPTNPPWAIWPPVWFVKIENEIRSNPSRAGESWEIPLDVVYKKENNINLKNIKNGMYIVSERESPAIFFASEDKCRESKYLGLEIDVWRSKPGWTRLYWGSGSGYSEKKSLNRFYPSGNVKMQFAMERESTDRYFKLELLRGVDRWRMQDWAKEHENDKSFFVPPSIEPGGIAKIKRIDVFCLK
jgi:hypothetical protein